MSGNAYRLPEGGRLDRARPLGFTFNGKFHRGFSGDTLASALLANGVHLVGRSFKYHRPRGVFSAGSEEPNALVQLGRGARTEPNIRATQAELYEGLVAASVNCWPGVTYDLGAVASWFARLLPAGFYYKTFMWPPGLWRGYEFFIRHAAGLGRTPEAPDPDRYEKRHLRCDVLVVGAGPAGLAAALAAGRTGARVVLADEQNEFGGALLGNGEAIDGKPASAWVAAATGELSGLAEVRLLRRATVFGYYDHNYLAVLERVTDHLGAEAPAHAPRQRLWKIRAKQVVLATGAHERPMVFADNDRPGIMLAAAARTYLNRYAVKPGSRAVVLTNNDSAYGAAADLSDKGVAVAAVVDLRPEPGPAAEAAYERGIEVISGRAVVATEGGRRVKAVVLRELDESGAGTRGPERRLECDTLCVSGGWNPTVHLFSQSGGKLRFDDASACFVPGEGKQAARVAGSASGAFDLLTCLDQGFAAGSAAAADAGIRRKGRARKRPSAEAVVETPARPLLLLPPAVEGRREKHFVDLASDVTAADIALAHREGFGAVEHLKRYTTLGMGTDQGKTSNVAGLAVLAELRGTDIPSLGTTTFRPPYTPVSFGAMGGRDVGEFFAPERKTPLYHWHAAAGARFEDVGLWRRASHYPRPGETMDQAVTRECRAVRERVGIIDVSTLGKIDLQGPDAVELLNRVYTNAWDSLAVGGIRYGVMLGEHGMVIDDGVTARLGEHHYLMSTTSGGAASVFGWLDEWLQCEWTELRVHCTSVTEQWAVANIAGPGARRLLAELGPDFDTSAEAFPHMSWRAGTVAGLPARVFRVSFTGELSYEIAVPAGYGQAMWNALMTAGEKHGIAPVGIEALSLLRAEKGHFIVGYETDGSVAPGDLGLDWLLSKKKQDYIGLRSLSRPDTAREDRKQLVGLLTEDPREVLAEGGQIVAELRERPPMPMIGHVTSTYFSPTLGRSIALALLQGGAARHGETVQVNYADKTVRATVTSPHFHDPEGERLNG